MSFVKKTWVDRISEYPNRRTINDGYVTKQVTVARDEGTVSVQGDAFNASNMNDLEDRIDAAITASGASTLNELTDVNIDTPTDGQALVYDADNDEWINADVGGGGSYTAGDNIDITSNVVSVDGFMTANEARTIWANV